MPHLQNHKIKRVDIHVHVKTAPSCGKCSAVVIVPRLADQQSTRGTTATNTSKQTTSSQRTPVAKLNIGVGKKGDDRPQNSG